MDIESFVEEHQGQWARLAELAHTNRRLTGPEADELVDLYQTTATQLTAVRATAYDPEVEARLAALVSDARASVTGASPPLLSNAGRFFTRTLPAALYAQRCAALGTAAVSLLVAFVAGWRVANEPGLIEQYMSPAQIERLVEYDFAAYYTENPAAEWALQLWLNNTLVTAMCLLTGIVVLPALMLLYSNMTNLGLVAGLMLSRGRADVFFGLLLPHGLLEMTCMFFGAAAGLRLAWAWVSPGPMTRTRALGRAGRAAGVVALGLAIALGVSGLLEAFVTPSQLPAWARLAIGAWVWLGFLAYVLVVGRRATLAGASGDLDGAGAEQVDPTAFE